MTEREARAGTVMVGIGIGAEIKRGILIEGGSIGVEIMSATGEEIMTVTGIDIDTDRIAHQHLAGATTLSQNTNHELCFFRWSTTWLKMYFGLMEPNL